MAKIISLSARLKKPKDAGAALKAPTLPPALKPVSERVQILEKNTWTIVQYVEKLEERVAAQEKYLLKLLRLLRAAGLEDQVPAASKD